MAYSKNQLKIFNSLTTRKYRQKYNLFIVEGHKLANDLLSSSFKVKHLFATENWIADHIVLLKERTIDYGVVSERELKNLSQLSTPNQVVCIVDLPNIEDRALVLDEGVHLYLDALQDPGNVGTILRTADWFGLDSVVLGPNTVDVFSNKVVQASMGGIFRVRIQNSKGVSDLEKVSTPIFVADASGTPIQNIAPPEKGVIILGNEGNGVNKDFELLPNVKKISIPRHPRSQMESLNVGIAAGILSEWIAR